MVWIPGGTLLMGSNRHYPEESPAHIVTVDGFWMDEFRGNEPAVQVVLSTETGYVTLCEKAPNPDDYPGAKPELLSSASVV